MSLHRIFLQKKKLFFLRVKYLTRHKKSGKKKKMDKKKHNNDNKKKEMRKHKKAKLLTKKRYHFPPSPLLKRPSSPTPRLQNYQAQLNRAQSTFKTYKKPFSNSPALFGHHYHFIQYQHEVNKLKVEIAQNCGNTKPRQLHYFNNLSKKNPKKNPRLPAQHCQRGEGGVFFYPSLSPLPDFLLDLCTILLFQKDS